MPAAKSSKSRGADSAAYRRSKRPVRVRRWIFDWRNWPLRRTAAALLVAAVFAAIFYGADRFVAQSPRFQLGEDSLVVTGLDYVQEDRIRAYFADDFGESVADIPLENRRLSVLGTPWVAEAAVVRLWPNRIWVAISERRPTAFVRAPGPSGALELRMIDNRGVFLEPVEGEEFDLPVVDGIDPALPQEEREKRIRLYQALIADLDSAEPPYSDRISQVNLAAADNAVLLLERDGEVIELEMGDEHFRSRFEVYLEYIDSWQRQFGKVASVDLRLKEQVVVQPANDQAKVQQLRGGA